MKEETHCLSRLLPGQKGRIVTLYHTPCMKRRLEDMGFIPGSEVECVGCSPGCGMKAYLIRGAVIALRSCDSGRIQIRQEETKKWD